MQQQAPGQLNLLLGERIRNKQTYLQALTARNSALEQLYTSIGPGSEKWKNRIARRDGAKAEYEAIAAQLGRPLNRLSLPPLGFYALAVGLALVETPVNKFLFDVALQSSNVASYLVSFAVAAFLLIGAHFAGKLVRQVWSELKKKLYVSNIIIACVIALVLAAALSILTIGRAEFSAAALASGLEGLFSNVGDKVTASGGLLQAIAVALGDTSALVLITVNLTSILVAFLLGYFSHDSDKHFDKAFEKHRAAERSLERLEETFARKRGRVLERAGRELADINHRYIAANAAIVSLKTALGMPLDDDDKLALPDLEDRAGRGGFGGSDGDDGLRGELTQAELDALVRAGPNVTRVAARDAK